MNKRIIVSAPGKLMLLGEHAVVYHHPCIVTAVDSRIRVTVERRGDGFLEINAPQLQAQPYKKLMKELHNNHEIVPKEFTFLRKVVQLLAQRHKITCGVTIYTDSDFSHRYGFGSSSAVSVAAIKGLSELFKLGFDQKQIFDYSYQVTLAIQGVGSGFDSAAAVYGGTLYFLTGGRKIEQITDKPLPLIVVYSGIKADTPTLVRKVADLKKAKPVKVEEIFGSIERIVEEGQKLIREGKWPASGKLFQLNQEILVKLGVSTPKINRLCDEAVLAGAYGAKLSGAGGGDCLIVLTPEEKQNLLKQVIEKAGGEILNVRTSAEGVRIEKG